MKWLSLLLLLVSLASVLRAADNQAYLAMFAATRVTKMIGMADMLKGVDEAMVEKMPGMAVMLGLPQREFIVRLWSPGIAPPTAAASLAPPAGLKLGARLDLSLFRPKAEPVEGPGAGPGTDAVPDFTIKRYWGSSPTVKPGQPEVVSWQGMTPEQKAAMRAQTAKSQAGRYFYKLDWTSGYWPADVMRAPVAKDAALQGLYTLTTNYTGRTALEVPETVNFLAPLEFTSPKLDAAPPLDKPLAFAWKPVPNVLGYLMLIIGIKGKNTLIMWSSSEIAAGLDVEAEYLQMATVRELVKTTALMGPDRQDATVPAGIFQDCDMVTLMMYGYGPGAATAEGQPLPRLQTKTTLNVILGGKMMLKPGEMGGPVAGGAE